MMSTGIGDGLILRPARFEDIEGVVAVSNGYTLALVGEASRSANETLTDWQSPGFSLERDARVVAAGGEIVAHGEVWDTSEPHVRVHARMAIAPTWRGREIEEALLSWIEERAEKAVLQAPAVARVVLTQSYVEQDHAMHSLLEARGYVLVRRFWRMLIELDEPPPEPQWPEGIRVRTFVPGEDDVAMAAAVRDAFRDHWGDVERPLEEELKEWRHWMENSTDFDPSLWFLAVDGDEIAGVSLCWPVSPEDRDRAGVEVLGVRRPWRKRGIALALLRHSFSELRHRGKTSVKLGVDSHSLTGATRVYERAGMSVSMEIRSYEKELRPGVDLSTQALS
jgi:GNAT superfamily N-acetyltransferase